MAVYKDEKTNTWRVLYRYTDWNGERKQTQKRGFKTKREAQAWEREQLNKLGGDLDMSFKSFVEHYTAGMQSRIKENTWATKEHIIQTKLIPYFGKLKMCNITAQQIITWQNELINHKDENGKQYSPVYLKTIHNQLSAIFNHAVRYYNLKENPCKKSGSMGKKKNREIAEKTDEYKSLSDRVRNYDKAAETLKEMETALNTSPKYQLPEPQGLMTAKSYKSKIVEPLIKRMKSLIKTLVVRCFQAIDDYHRLNVTNANLYRENEHLKKSNSKLTDENENLRIENRDYKLIRKVFGNKRIDDLLEQARSKQREKRFRNIQNERQEKTMAKTIFEEMGGTYVRQGDYNLPCLSLPAEKENKPIGVWGQRHLRYIRQYKRILYTNLPTSGKLNSYLADIDEQAEEMFFRLVKQMAEREGVTEQLKAENQMEWVGRMNNICNQVTEIVNTDLIYA